ncbi:hypothetical protein RFI_35959, partial [Reticulomyxa filosa]
KYELSLTFLEIYNKKLKDLLQFDNVAPKQLRIQQSSQFIMDDLLTLIELGQSKSVAGSTTMNENSSHSHNCEDTVGFSEQVSTLYLINLAGSERAGVTNAANDELSNKRLKYQFIIDFFGNELFCNDKKKKIKYLNKQNYIVNKLLQDNLGVIQ